MKGVTLANAAFTLSLFLNDTRVLEVRALCWLASVAAMVLTYDAAMVSTLIVVFVPGWPDVVLPFFAAIVEFLLFSALQKPETLVQWHLLFALFGLTALGVLSNMVSKMKAENYETQLHKLVEDYRAWMKRDRRHAGLHALAWLVIYTAFVSFPGLQRWQWVSGLLALGLMIVAVANQEHDRRRIAKQVDDIAET